ncbi:SDR family oxidoreductase [Streptomyces aurantiacus]|uniref:Short-chain dehydrogenase/reductase n=1 Tax=Streptomyces aurantiacus TaxID=47760 RepID=A0A7G1NUM7_9ACTN|nr:SDR family oxidoreductase [Streptomyces aurantiacus]BCL25266.1 short-chain dehydrogenase/reductase [Streptomyces aurantiacus]
MTRTWFITGTSSGFGRHLTEQLLARGDRVAATARRPESLDDLAARYGSRLWRSRLDVTDTTELREVVDRAFAELARIDVVVSNAGYGLFGAAEELTDEQIDRQIATNLTASIQLARAATGHLRRQGGGRYIQIASIGGQVAFPAMSLYHATKWGIEGFWESAAAELAPFGIGVTLVEPGVSRTNFGAGGSVLGAPLPEYADGPSGQLRAILSGELPPLPAPGDPAKIAAAIIASADRTEAPLRLTLGSDAYALATAALRGRLEALEAGRGLAHSTDADDVTAPAPAPAGHADHADH